MKGIELTVSTIILIVLGLIVLIAFILLMGTSKGQVDIITVREALRNCCADRSIYDCKTSSLATAKCRVPWNNTVLNLGDLANEAQVEETSLCSFCFCSSTACT